MTTWNEAWSWTKLDVYRTCPRKFKYQFIDKIPQPDSPALKRGSEIHKGLESWLNGWQSALPEAAEKWRQPLQRLKDQPTVKPEQALGLNKDWSLRKDWFGKDCWLRVKMDAYYFTADELVAIDFKTGKYRIPSTDQVELYACAGIELAPHVKQVRAEFWFIDTEELYHKIYTVPEIQDSRRKFERAIVPMYNDTTWKATPSQECRWCPYSKTKGGSCEF
ncbi:MAG: PD-(D/E)XK nuclease family protein [Desulfurellales bacterium]|nr:MAG: PD-(D/E)XK nuclease family protein [Desulfurellales bacterium]